MAVFQITPTEDAERLEQIVISTFEERDRFILPGRTACFVRFDGTSLELAQRLDLAGEHQQENRPCPAVITLVTMFGGYAPTSLWEWLKTRMGD